MTELLVRCYAEINDLLPAEVRYRDFPVRVPSGSRLRELLGLLGIPESAVDLILVDGSPSSFETPLPSGCRVSVYPMFESFDIAPVGPANRVPLRHPRFLADGHLARLARDLRMLGIDADVRHEETEEDLIRRSHTERRAILSRDRALIADARVNRGYLVRSSHPRDQLLEVLRRFDLASCLNPLSRCIRCNVLLENLCVDDVRDRLPERVREHPGKVCHCPACGRLYWEGSHVGHMGRIIAGIVQDLGHTASDGGGD